VKFSTRTLYGLKAILVLAGRYGEGLLSVSSIAKKENISVHYLEQILNSLKKKGLVKSVRGPQGGYALAQKPSEITLFALYTALETRKARPAAPVSETDETGLAHSLFLHKFSASIEKGLSAITLKQLVDEARQQKKGKQRASAQTFHI
jgi:Rrf2 family transcriptional regulator, cysteine metabolism repressor